MKYGTHEWEWAGVNFLTTPMAFKDPLMVRLSVDIFDGYTDDQLDQIFAVMALTPQHTYQILTKRPERMLEYCSDRFRSRKILEAAQRLGVKGLIDPGMVIPIYPYGHIWLGVPVENQKAADERIPLLLQTPAAVRFLSCEPLLEEVDLTDLVSGNAAEPGGELHTNCLSLEGLEPEDDEEFGGNLIDWVIVGGESGPKARPCNLPWIQSIVDQCAAAKVPCFVKQLGANVSSLPVDYGDFGRGSGKMNNPEQWPPYLRVRQMPA